MNFIHKKYKQKMESRLVELYSSISREYENSLGEIEKLRNKLNDMISENAKLKEQVLREQVLREQVLREQVLREQEEKRLISEKERFLKIKYKFNIPKHFIFSIGRWLVTKPKS